MTLSSHRSHLLVPRPSPASLTPSATIPPTMEALKKCARAAAFPLAFAKPIGEVELSDDERDRLNTNFVDAIWQSSYSRSFLVWRFRLLCSASVFYVVGTTIRVVDIVQQCGGFVSDGRDEETGDYVSSSGEEISNYTTLGKATLISQRIAPFCSLLVILIAAWFWTVYSKSRNVLVPGWLLTLLLSLWPMLVPLTYLLDESNLSENALLSAGYAVQVMPTWLSITAGMMVGFKRVFAFSPSPLSGAMVVLSAIFAIIIPFTALSMVVQMLGDYLLVSGVSFLVISPVVIVIGTSHFTDSNHGIKSFGSSDYMQKCNRFFLASDFCRAVGLVLVLAWTIKIVLWAKKTAGVTDAEQDMVARYILNLMDTKNLVGMVFEFIGGMLFNAVLWTDIAVHVSRNDSAKMQKLDSDLY